MQLYHCRMLIALTDLPKTTQLQLKVMQQHTKNKVKVKCEGHSMNSIIWNR